MVSSNNEIILQPGGNVGSYTLVRKLRDGGMAALYLAKRSGVHGFTRPVAIKVVHAHLSALPEFAQMFIDEALLGSHLSHPNIVHVEEFGELPDGRCFLAMEYVDGCSLWELASHQRKSETTADVQVVAHIGIKTADALHSAHSTVDANGDLLGVVHRDVSPGNVLLSRRGHVKVVDFGIAKSSLRMEHTTESLKGKLRYMSPEQATGKDLDPRSDVYSLGLVLWELLAGRRVFKSKRDLALLDEVRDPNIPPPSLYAEHVPDDLDEVILKALSKNPDDRYPTARAFSKALRMAVPDAVEVEPAEIAMLVSEIPTVNVDREVITHTPSKPGSEAVSGRRKVERVEIDEDIPVAVEEMEPVSAPNRTPMYAVAVAALVLLIVGAVWATGSSEPEVEVDAPTEAAAVVPTPDPQVDPEPLRTRVAAPTETPEEAASAETPEAVPTRTAQAPATSVSETPRANPARIVTPASAEGPTRRSRQDDEPSRVIEEPVVSSAVPTSSAAPRTRVGMTLLADDEDDGHAVRRSMRSSVRVGMTLLAE